MKKELIKKIGISFIFILLISVILVHSQIIKTNKKEYSLGDSVYTSSSVSVNDKLCRANNNTEVNLFIVEDKESWEDGDSLSDVRDSSNKIPNARFSLRKVWDAVTPGKYDIVIDCNENSVYDIGEPLFNEGFTIAVKKGRGTISRGVTINDFTWNYDPEIENMLNEILSLRISAVNENILLKNISLTFSNNNEKENKLNIESLEIYDDENNNGNLDDEDKIGEKIFESSIDDKQMINIEIEDTVNKNENKSLLIVYKMSSNTEKGNYSLKVNSITGEGELSKEVIMFSGLPLSSNALIVSEEKTCVGILDLKLSSDNVKIGENLIASISNISGCDGKTVLIKSDFCYTPDINTLGSCKISGNVCTINFKLSKNTTIYACLDKNNDGDFSDVGETKSSLITIIKEVVNETKDNATTDEKEEISTNVSLNETNTATGKVIEGKENNENQLITFFGGPGAILLIEVTLVLILFVLIMILFKLRAPITPMETVESSESEVTTEELLEDKEDKKKVKKK